MSSESATSYDGYTLYFATGDIPASSIMVINGASVPNGVNGVVEFGWPIVSSIKNNSETHLIILDSAMSKGMTSFTIRNMDTVNPEGFTLMVPYKIK